MNIIVNGISTSLQQPISIDNFLKDRNITPSHVVVEINGEIVYQESFTSYQIKENDKIEILRFVGGG